VGEEPVEYPSLKVLIFALGTRAVYRPILYSTREIFCGPDCESAVEPTGQVRVLQTPVGEYDASQFKSLTGWDEPDLVVVKADATGRNFPANLAAFRCPKVLVVGNTQHLESPIGRLLHYARQEHFDCVTSDHKRHHLHFFVEAGFSKVVWLPGLNVYPHPQSMQTKRLPRVLFVGQTGIFHPFRNQVLAALKESGIPLTVAQVPQGQAAALYAESLIDLNCSLNGDLNLRVFEIMSSGGFLLTDRLAPEAGLEVLFKEGQDYEAWNSVTELREKALYYLANPEKAIAIAQHGQEAFWARHRPERKATELVNWVATGQIAPEYEVTEDSRTMVVALGSVESVSARAVVYERIQEMQLHRAQSRVLVSAKADSRIVLDLVDLPRVETTITGTEAEAPEDQLALWKRANIAGRVKWLGNPESTEHPEPWDVLVPRGEDGASAVVSAVLDQPAFEVALSYENEGVVPQVMLDAMAAVGFFPKGRNPRLLVCEQPSFLGQALLAKGERRKALHLLRDAVGRFPEDPDWFTETGVLAIKLGQGELAELCLRSAIELRPTHGMAREVLVALLRGTNRVQEASRVEEVLDVFPRGKYVEPEGALLSRKRILVLSNLFPPQELGGYGRLMADFTELLRRRGHDVRVLSSDTRYLGDTPEFEPGVERSLRLFGTWKAGLTNVIDAVQAAECVAENRRVLANMLRTFQPEICLLGNIDFVGSSLIGLLLAARVPVLHHLGNSTPGYSVNDVPQSPLYRIAAASVWLARKIMTSGYPLSRVDVVYPGGLVNEFRCQALPERNELRIAYASIVLPYKGAHVLVSALTQLHRQGVPFTCTIAGTTTEQGYVDKLKAWVDQAGMSKKVSFVGFLDRSGLKKLFSNHNVLAFPSQFEEPFGISQVEAMAAGMVVVGTGTGGSAEVVEHERSGVLVPPGESLALAEALASLPADDERWRGLAEAGQVRATTFFDIRRSVDQLEVIFAELLKSELDGRATR
jgi:glycosyltransferase involved in cell wall biosynthesis